MTLIYFILILSITIFIHELGHYIFAKKAGIYVYEFAIGMGPRIFTKKRKNDETTYSIRLIPLGGFVSMAGEQVEEDENIPKEKRLQSKTWGQRFMAVIAGVMFNFIFAILLLFVLGLFYGAPIDKPIVGGLEEGYPAVEAGIEEGDTIISINNKSVKSWDDLLLYIELYKPGDKLSLEVEKENGKNESYEIIPKKITEDETTYYKIGISPKSIKKYGLIPAVKYAVNKTGSLFKTMFIVIKNLITGDLGLNRLSGPVGIYNVVGESAAAGFENILYLIAFLSINIGFINLLPIPAFDGGRLLFLIIEKIKGKPVNSKVENYIHAVGFVLLIGLLLVVTWNDISKIFG
ncbi:MAG: RIP metalloprotease RseP [Bacilli bacterium]